MNELPDLVLRKIFGCLSFYEKMKIRCVCKLWKNFIENGLNCRRELVVFYELAQMPVIWYHSGQLANLNNSVMVNRKFTESNYFTQIFKNIRNLYIAYYNQIFEHQKKLEELIAKFPRLEHLQVHDMIEYMDSPVLLKAKFESTNLRNLFLSHTDSLTIFDCPNLVKLSFYGAFCMTEWLNPRFRNLQFLRVNTFDYEPGAELPNLQVICFCDTIKMDIVDFRSLKEIHYFYHKACMEYDMVLLGRRHRRMQLMEILNEFLKQKQMQQRDDLSVYYDGFLYRDDQEFWDFLLPKKALNIPLDYFGNRISPNRYPGTRNSTEFLSYVRSPKIESTFKSFILSHNRHREVVEEISKGTAGQLSRSTVALWVSGVTIEDVSGLKIGGWFKYAKYLKVDNLSQQVLDLLPDLAPNVLKIKCTDLVEAGVTNCRFMSKFKAMKSLYIQVGMFRQADELRAVLDNCKISLVKFKSSKRNVHHFLSINQSKWMFEIVEQNRTTKFEIDEGLLDHLIRIKLI